MNLDKVFENFDKYDDTYIRENEEYIKYIQLIFSFDNDIFRDYFDLDVINNLNDDLLQSFDSFLEIMKNNNSTHTTKIELNDQHKAFYKIYKDLDKANIAYEALQILKTNPLLTHNLSSYLLF